MAIKKRKIFIRRTHMETTFFVLFFFLRKEEEGWVSKLEILHFTNNSFLNTKQPNPTRTTIRKDKMP